MARLSDLTDGAARRLESLQVRTEEFLFEPVIRLGVTGLSRSGKSVFITSLVANLMGAARMPQFRAAADGRLLQAFLQPQPNDALARFPFEDHMARLRAAQPSWPENTRALSQLRLSLRVQPTGFLTGFTGPRTVHLDIVDYPGEWLLDLPLLHQGYAEWSARSLGDAATPARAAVAEGWLRAAHGAEASATLDEPKAQALAGAFTDYLRHAREAGFSACAPGRFLMPGDLEGSPALTFAPLPAPPGKPARDSLYAAFERRFEAYKRIVVKPFFRDHFARIDRQIVLVDVLSAIGAGPQALDDLRAALRDILAAFRPGPNSWLSSILGRRVEKIAFAATKADHVHHSEHDRLAALMSALVADARDRAAYKGAKTESFALAALRATVEDRVTHDGQVLNLVRGTQEETGREVAFHPGTLPEDPAHLLAPAGAGELNWDGAGFAATRFRPPHLTLKPGEGPPHIRLDRVAEYLIGDRLL